MGFNIYETDSSVSVEISTGGPPPFSTPNPALHPGAETDCTADYALFDPTGFPVFP